MELAALMVILGLMGTMYSSPVCKHPCSPARARHLPHFQHVLDLQDSSAAPWELIVNATEDREPQHIEHAVCKNCTVKDMVAKPIFIQITVYKRIRNSRCKNHTNSSCWCECPYNLAVGCTCVNERQQ